MPIYLALRVFSIFVLEYISCLSRLNRCHVYICDYFLYGYFWIGWFLEECYFLYFVLFSPIYMCSCQLLEVENGASLTRKYELILAFFLKVKRRSIFHLHLTLVFVFTSLPRNDLLCVSQKVQKYFSAFTSREKNKKNLFFQPKKWKKNAD